MTPRLKLEVCAFFVDEFRAALAAEKRGDVEIVPIQGACDERRRTVPTEMSPAQNEMQVLRLMCACSGGTACQKSPHSCFEFLLGPDKVDALLGEGAHLLTPAMARAYPETLQSLNENPESLRAYFAESVRAWVVVDIGVAPLTAAEQANFLDATGGTMELLPTEPHLLRTNLRAALGTRFTGQIASLQHRLADYTMAYDLISRLIPHQGEQAIVNAILELFSMLCAPRAVHLLLAQGGGKDGDANIVGGAVQLFSLPADSGRENKLREDHFLTFLRCQAHYGEIETPQQSFYFQIHQDEQILGVVVVEGTFLPEQQHNYLDLALLLMPILRLALHNARSYERLCDTERELRASQMELEQRVEERTRELRESEERLKEAQRIAHVGSWRLDVATNHVVWSEELYRMLGLNPDLPPPDYTEHHRFFTPESWDRLSAILPRTQETGVPYELELEMVRADGRHGWMLARGEALRDASGSIVALQGVAADITDRKQAEAVLMQHKVVIDTSIDGFWITDMAGNLLEANEAYAKMSGYPVDELVNMHISQLEAIEQSPEEVHAHIAKIVAQGYDRFETRHRHKDGHEIDIEVSVAYMAESQQLFAFCRDITERMKTEEELCIAAEAFETQDAIMITDADGNIIRVNRAFSAITGYSLEEVLGKKQDVMNQGQHDDIACIGMLQQSIRDDLWTGEIWDKRKNGQIYPKWMTVTAVKNERHETTHYVIIFSDITARKQIEKENLRESDLRFRGTLEQAAVGIAHATLDGHFRQVNQKLCNIVGYARDELINMSYQDITFSADLDENFYFMQQLLAGKISTFSIEKRYVRKNQSLVWVNLTVSLLRDADGASKYTIGVIEDISERKQAEVLVQQFGHLLQGSFNEIYLFDANSLYFLLTSEGAEKNLGYSDDELNQLTPLDLKPSLTRESFEQMLAPLRSGERQSLFFETIHRRKDGTTYPVEVRLQFMQAEHPVFLAIVQDITVRKQAEIEINQSRQLLRDLVAQSEALREEERKCLAREVHDELGQTLTALRMNVSLLRIEFGEHDSALLERVKGITELLDQSIQCTRDVVSNLRPVALDMGIVAAVKWLCDEFIKHTGTSCIVYTPEEEIHLDELVSVAAFRIAQESLTNAARYAEASKVEIIIKQDTDNFSVTVNDNGKGFDYMAIPNHQSFGLLGMRERAIALGGVVNIYSTPQQGTQVSLTVPNTRILTDAEGNQP